MKNHLESITRHQREGSRMQAHYLSWRSQDEFINECAEFVQGALLKEVMEAVNYAVITDGAPDVSHTKQITFI